MERFLLRAVICCLVFTCVKVAFTLPASASAWNIDNKQVLIISRADYFTSDLGNISVMDVPVPGQFQRFESNTYIEFGLTSDIMIGGKVFYGTSWLTRGTETESASGISEFEGFVQYQLFRNARHAGAVKIAAGVPSDFSSGVRPSLESDGVDTEVTALYGRSLLFEPVRIFAAAEIGYRKRFSDSADQARLLTTIGIEPHDRFTFLLDTFSIKSLENERFDGADFDIVKIQPSLVWRARRRLGVQIGVSEEIAGRNIDLGRTYFIGLQTRF